MSKFLLKFSILGFCACLILALNIDISSAGMGKRFKENQYKHNFKKNTSSISGEISGIFPTYIAVITHTDQAARTDTETIFLIDEDVEFQRKNLNQLAEGDTVKVTFENVTEPDPDDAENEKFVQRVTKSVQYLSSKSKNLKAGKK